MPKMPKEKPAEEIDEPEEPENVDSWEADQKEHDYYYDDSHGYEKYEPEDEEEF